MSKESATVLTVLDHLRRMSSTHAQRIEDAFSLGIPDLNLCHNGAECWIEFKRRLEYPERASTRVLGNEGLRPEQLVWLLSRQAAGGKVLVIVRVAKDYYMFDDHFRVLNSMTQEQMKMYAVAWWSGAFDASKILWWLHHGSSQPVHA